MAEWSQRWTPPHDRPRGAGYPADMIGGEAREFGGSESGLFAKG